MTKQAGDIDFQEATWLVRVNSQTKQLSPPQPTSAHHLHLEHTLGPLQIQIAVTKDGGLLLGERCPTPKPSLRAVKRTKPSVLPLELLPRRLGTRDPFTGFIRVQRRQLILWCLRHGFRRRGTRWRRWGVWPNG
jgi:hypothetical protein